MLTAAAARLLVAPLTNWKAAMAAMSCAHSFSKLSGAIAVNTTSYRASSLYVFFGTFG